MNVLDLIIVVGSSVAVVVSNITAYYIGKLKGFKEATLPTTLYFKNGSWTDMKGNYYNVVAWQPLPAPYKGGKENE